MIMEVMLSNISRSLQPICTIETPIVSSVSTHTTM